MQINKNTEAGKPTYNSIIFKNTQKTRYGVFIVTPSIGTTRMEWSMARYSQIIPCNWSYKQSVNWLPKEVGGIGNCAPIGYLVADAQNIGVKSFIEANSEWLFLIEEDNILPPDCFLRMNDHMRSMKNPIVSGLYFTKSFPAEPLVYRGRGNGYFSQWKIGDDVWCDAVPTGCVIIHRSIIQTIWNESPEYMAGNVLTRRVFKAPESVKHDPEKGWDTSTGTSDMEFCSEVIVNKVLERSGWKKHQNMLYPFLVDTKIFVGHMDPSGRNYPSEPEKLFWATDPKKRNKI